MRVDPPSTKNHGLLGHRAAPPLAGAGLLALMAAMFAWRSNHTWVPLPVTWAAYVAEQERFAAYEVAALVVFLVFMWGFLWPDPVDVRGRPRRRRRPVGWTIVVLAAIAAIAAWCVTRWFQAALS